MKSSRLLLISVAAVTGIGAFIVMSGREPPPAPVAVPVAPPVPTMETVDVLVAAAELPMGQTLKAPDLRWQPWPKAAAGDGFLQRSGAPTALEDTVGSIVRNPFLAGEPIRREKLIKANGSGFLSAILPSGMRAVAISIDARGSNTAGGFILPNDRVDVLRTYRDEEASRSGSGGDVQVSETILSNIRVLAVGQTVQERNGERVVTGDTATLELTPAQAEAVTLGQKVGQLSLALRSLADAGQAAQPAAEPQGEGGGVTVVRYGVAKQMPRR
ncbi:Flp pilus assembly protein CpaB [Methylobacterium nonmethylotrophicum]|uniref:Flp pilus assembly protein CpaB n=1 Tax=Methylobacterium nonmethylotrophicum TaxID=1141884 RepID=A0A4Z0NPJ7_9HYPH|nr:Flp pilus assembly protein CpaB [Methylobacterium nonmethylotrophicum]TGD98596.1 Flp pilus assembly protein CpaB [Methylobacterium nonmethylotrophicum]